MTGEHSTMFRDLLVLDANHWLSLSCFRGEVQRTFWVWLRALLSWMRRINGGDAPDAREGRD